MYRIIPMPWRSLRFTEFLRDLDDYHRAARLGTRGMQPREREEDPALTPVTFPIPFGLPKNCYCSKFLDNLKVERPLYYRSLRSSMKPAVDFDALTGVSPPELVPLDEEYERVPDA